MAPGVGTPTLADRRFEAVVFDLFGTLVPEFPREEFFDTVRTAAEMLGAEPGSFLRGWARTAVERQTGAFVDGLPGNVRAICAALGVPAPTDDEVARALRPRATMYERWFHPRAGAAETLEAVRARGYPVGLISMCAPDTPALWRGSVLAPLVDVTVFSSEVGLRKPAPAIYHRCCAELGVEPDAVLYCGDGSYAELSGAEAVGMVAVEIRDPAVDRTVQLRPEAEDWNGLAVADLRELLTWLPGRSRPDDGP